MNSLFPTDSRIPWSRREVLASMAAMAGGVTLARNARAEEKPKAPEAKADTLIVLWMGGGMAHTETFDPKRYTPFSPGVKASQVLSTFPAIPTAIDGEFISDGLEKVASVLDRGALVRSHVLGDLGHILHSRHQYHWHTGYEPPLTVAAPHIGAWLTHGLGPRDPAVPGYIDIGQRYEGNGEAEELKAFQTGGCLGTEYGPFRVANPDQAVNVVRPPAGMSMKQFRARHQALLKLIAASPVEKKVRDVHREALLRSIDDAYRLLASPSAKAFDLSLEPKESYDKYNICRFGQGCLLARRLTEAGARYIEVTTEYGPFKQWDTHDNGHTRLAQLKKEIDAPIAQLVLDLEERGLLDRTLIVLASEFSRDMLVEGKPDKPVPNQVKQPDVIQELKFYGMHRHFTAASSVLMFGGGIKKGLVYGRTADERPCGTIKDPITITDLHATMFTAMGVSPEYHVEVEKRPFYVTKDGLGKPRMELFA